MSGKKKLLSPYFSTAVQIKHEEVTKGKEIERTPYVPREFVKRKVIKAKRAFELDEIHMKTLQTIFTLLDKDQDKLLTTHEVRLAIVALGIPPSKKLIDEIEGSVPSWAGKGKVDYNTFKRVIIDRLKSNPVHLSDVDELFKKFEKTDGKGVVTPKHLRRIMSITTSNETQLTGTEIDEMFDELSISNAPLYYRKFLADVSSGFVNFI